MTSLAGGADCIMAKNNAVSASPGITYQNTNLTIRNNTCYYSKTWDQPHGISVLSVGTGHVVTNNLIYFETKPSNGWSWSACFDTSGLTTSAFTSFDYNLCSNAQSWMTTPSLATWQSLPTWQASAGSPDAHSSTSSAMLVGVPSQSAPNNAALQSTSPAKNKGSTVYFSPTDILKVTRDASPDIGAYEYTP
jgi:hypothetical protein